jgi:F-type H+-transporting ATPase subunit b
VTINWWTLGLQAVNFLILVWLLSRVFWRPVAAAIVTRQTTAKTLLDKANATQSKADATLTEVTAIREGMTVEREALLADAQSKAEASAKASLEAASGKAEALLRAAQQTRERETDAARASNQVEAALLAVDIARRLLARMDTREIQTSFLDLLVDAVNQIPSKDKQVLLKTVDGIDLVSALQLDKAAKAEIASAVGKALGGEPSLNFLIDSDLIAGYEIRTAHFSLSNSWHSDLEAIQKDLKNAA